MGPEVLKVAMGRQTAADVAEFVRKEFVNAMRNGDNLCLDIGASTPDWASYQTEGTFNAELFFNWDYMTVEANYMPLVRDSENHGIGGVNPGCGYCRNPNFSATIRSGAETEEEI